MLGGLRKEQQRVPRLPLNKLSKGEKDRSITGAAQNSESMVKEKKILSERSLQNIRAKVLELQKPIKTKLEPRKLAQKPNETHHSKEYHKEEGEDNDDVEHFNAELESDRIVFSPNIDYSSFISKDETIKYPLMEIRDALNSTGTLPRGSPRIEDIECISEASDSASPSKGRQSPKKKKSPTIVNQLEKKVKEQVSNTRRNQLDRYYNENTFLGCGRVSLETINFE